MIDIEALMLTPWPFPVEPVKADDYSAEQPADDPQQIDPAGTYCGDEE
jgi:hypothetical protein